MFEIIKKIYNSITYKLIVYAFLLKGHDNVIEIHHNDGNHGNNKYRNLVLLHGHCHDIIHSKGMYDKHQTSRGAV